MVRNKEQKIDRLSSFMFPVQNCVVGGPTNTIRETAKILFDEKKPRKCREKERQQHILGKKEETSLDQ